MLSERLGIAALSAAFEGIVGENPDPKIIKLTEKAGQPEAQADRTKLCIACVRAVGADGAPDTFVGKVVMRPILASGDEVMFAEAIVAMHLVLLRDRRMYEFGDMRHPSVAAWYAENPDRRASAWSCFRAVMAFAAGDREDFAEVMNSSFLTIEAVGKLRADMAEHDARHQADARKACNALAVLTGGTPIPEGERVPDEKIVALLDLVNGVIGLLGG